MTSESLNQSHGLPISTGSAVCALCGAIDNVATCPHCRKIFYCSKLHQIEHWKFHKPVCIPNKTGTSDQPDMPNTAEVVVRSTPQDNASGQDRPQFGLWPDQNDGDMTENFDTITSLSIDAKTGTLEKALKSTDNLAGYESVTSFSDIRGSAFAFPGSQHSMVGEKESGISTAAHIASSPMLPFGNVVIDVAEETKIANYVVDCLHKFGICVVDNFLNDNKPDAILNEVKFLHKSNCLLDGQILSPQKPEAKVRSDKITWINKGDPRCPNISGLIHRLDSLMLRCKDRLVPYDISGRTRVSAVTSSAAVIPARGAKLLLGAGTLLLVLVFRFLPKLVHVSLMCCVFISHLGDGGLLSGSGNLLFETYRQSERRWPMCHQPLLSQQRLGCEGKVLAAVSVPSRVSHTYPHGPPVSCIRPHPCPVSVPTLSSFLSRNLFPALFIW